MQVFILGTPYETATFLDNRRLRKQILECRQILNALSGISEAWKNHPCTLQYKDHRTWLELYLKTLELFVQGDCSAELCSQRAYFFKPDFHTNDYLDQMKRRLYTKNNQFYRQWEYLGESDENWYFVDGVWRKYINGKRIM